MADWTNRYSLLPEMRNNLDVSRMTPEEYRRYQQIQNGNDPDFTDRQNNMWRLAQYASRRAKANHNYEIPARLIYKQWAHESGSNFDKNEKLFPVHNYGGLTQSEPNDLPQPDGANYYRKFQNDIDYANAYIDDYIKHYPEMNGVKNEAEYANILKKYGYYTAPEEKYRSDMEGILVPNSYVSDDYDFNYSNVANATMNPKSQVVNVSVNSKQPPRLLNLPQEQSRENYGVQFSANNRWQNFPQQRLMQLTPQSELSITPAAPKINNFSPVARSDQYLPQVNISNWTPYNNFRIPSSAVNSLKNNFGGFLRNIRGLFK